MNDVQALTPLVQKRTEGIQHYRFQLLQDRQAAVPDDRLTYVAKFATEESLIKTLTMTINGSSLEFNSDQITDLPAGVYRLEVWEMKDEVVHGIFPSNGFLKFLVNYNTQDLPTGKVSSLTIDEFSNWFADVSTRANPGNATFKVGEVISCDPDQPPRVDLATMADGTIIMNYAIPRGRDGDTWKPYVSDDGFWHLKLMDKKEDKDGAAN